MLASNFEWQKELATVPKANIVYSKTVLSKENHYHYEYQQDAVAKYTQLKK